jgi:membrane protease YdiL (CAAX protease family)
MALLRWLRVPDVPMPAIAGVSASVLLSSFVVTSFAAGLFEEAAYRGYLRSLLQSRYGGQVAIISAALVFALAHLSRGKGFLVVLPLVFLFGYLYGLVAWKTGSIWPGIVVHTSYNLYRLVEKFFTLTVK